MPLTKFFYPLVIFICLRVTVSGVPGFRIIGGKNVTISDFPYQVRLENYQRHYCGGAIIHKRFVLTAAHCIEMFRNMTEIRKEVLWIRVGSDWSETGGDVYQVEKVIPHEKYAPDAKHDMYDIGVVKTKVEFVFGKKVQMIALAVEEPREGMKGWVAGYGRQKPMRAQHKGHQRHLQAVELPILSYSTCKGMLMYLTEDMICAGGGKKDACVGDSGGALVVRGAAVGVSAWGVGCGREGYPGVYTNVALYRKWVEGVVSLNLKG